jgi:hypothetical protein
MLAYYYYDEKFENMEEDVELLDDVNVEVTENVEVTQNSNESEKSFLDKIFKK